MTVAILKANYENINEKVEEILNLINYKPKKNKILLKPNIVSPRNPDSIVITNPKVIEALIIYFKKFTDDIVIAEGSVIGRDTKVGFKKAGYGKLAEKYNVKLVDVNNTELFEVKWKYGKLRLPKLLKTHEFVNVPKMKTHMQTMVTLSIKNQKGLIPPENKKDFHKSGLLNEKIKALSKVLKPDLIIMDAIDCMEGNGPGSAGNKKTMNLLLAGKSLTEFDNVCVDIMGINPETVKYLEKSEKQTIGLSIDEVKSNFKLPTHNYKKLNTYIWANNACSGCTNNLISTIHSLPKHPLKAFSFIINGVIKRLDIVVGQDAKIENRKNKVICIGNCTRKIVEKNPDYIFIPGCPPSEKDILDQI